MTFAGGGARTVVRHEGQFEEECSQLVMHSLPKMWPQLRRTGVSGVRLSVFGCLGREGGETVGSSLMDTL